MIHVHPVNPVELKRVSFVLCLQIILKKNGMHPSHNTVILYFMIPLQFLWMILYKIIHYKCNHFIAIKVA